MQNMQPLKVGVGWVIYRFGRCSRAVCLRLSGRALAWHAQGPGFDAQYWEEQMCSVDGSVGRLPL